MLDQMTRPRIEERPVQQKSRFPVILVAFLTLVAMAFGGWALVERNRAGDLTAQVDELTAELGDLTAEFDGLTVQLDAVRTTNDQLATATGWLSGIANATPIVGAWSLTERQGQMVDMIEGPWSEAWYAADGEEIAAMFTPTGVMYDIAGGRVVSNEDGTLADFASIYRGLKVDDQLMVHGNRVFSVVELGGNQVGAVIEFTETGDLAVQSVAMYDSVLAPAMVVEPTTSPMVDLPLDYE